MKLKLLKSVAAGIGALISGFVVPHVAKANVSLQCARDVIGFANRTMEPHSNEWDNFIVFNIERYCNIPGGGGGGLGIQQICSMYDCYWDMADNPKPKPPQKDDK